MVCSSQRGQGYGTLILKDGYAYEINLKEDQILESVILYSHHH